MSDGTGQAMDGTFEAVDPKLNVFALANGMDLTKSDDSRSLEWFTEGLERSLPIEPDEGNPDYLRWLLDSTS
jgi:hypothetical protein